MRGFRNPKTPTANVPWTLVVQGRGPVGSSNENEILRLAQEVKERLEREGHVLSLCTVTSGARTFIATERERMDDARACRLAEREKALDEREAKLAAQSAG